jgi:hypothetical protein
MGKTNRFSPELRERGCTGRADDEHREAEGVESFCNELPIAP